MIGKKFFQKISKKKINLVFEKNLKELKYL